MTRHPCSRHTLRPGVRRPVSDIDTKAKAEKLIHSLLLAYHDRIGKLDWMGPATKREALKKLD